MIGVASFGGTQHLTTESYLTKIGFELGKNVRLLAVGDPRPIEERGEIELEDLARVAPGTPGGEWFRRYWLAVARTADL